LFHLMLLLMLQLCQLLLLPLLDVTYNCHPA